MKECSKCKMTFEDEVIFCPNCGAKLEEMAEEVSEKNTCVECGKEIDEECEFCPYCGAPQYEDEDEDEENEDAPTEQVKTESKAEETPLSPEDETKCKVRRWIGMGCSAILIVFPIINHGFSFGWFWYLLMLGVLFLFLMFYTMKEKNKETLDAIDGLLIILFIIWGIMYFWGPFNPDYSY